MLLSELSRTLAKIGLAIVIAAVGFALYLEVDFSIFILMIPVLLHICLVILLLIIGFQLFHPHTNYWRKQRLDRLKRL